MNVLHLSAASEHSGAGLAALMTHKALLKNNIQSRILFLKSERDLEFEVFDFSNGELSKRYLRLFISFLDRLPTFFYPKRKEQIFSPGFFGLNLRRIECFEWADVIHIHWANHGFIDIKEINTWQKPVVWTMRDMWAFTGGCHYSFECNSYQSTCGSCPVLNSSRKRDLSTIVLNRKVKHLSKTKIVWVAISDWMRRNAHSSLLLKDKSIPVIFSGIDCGVYNLRNTCFSKEYFNLPSSFKIILIGAGNLRQEYKGFNYVKEVMGSLPQDCLVVSFGTGFIKEGEIPQKILNLGYITNPDKLSYLYNAADVFFAPSIAEAFGKTFAEAQACGLPVVCFSETGPAEIVEHMVTGYVSNYKDVEDLKRGIEFCLNTNMNKKYISSRAKRMFDIDLIAKEYIRLYDDIINKKEFFE
jgi:glycosyltransferase involved in cell wall biosynthesis